LVAHSPPLPGARQLDNKFASGIILENPADKAELQRTGLPGPAIAVITGMRKPWRTVFSQADYAHVRDLGESYRITFPRRIVT